MKRNIWLFRICIGLLLGHAITAGIINTGSISAAGAFIGAGLFAVAVALCGNSVSEPPSTTESAADDTNTVGASERSAVTENRQ